MPLHFQDFSFYILTTKKHFLNSKEKKEAKAPVPFEWESLPHGSHDDELETKKPGLHGGQVCFSPDAGSFTAPSAVSLQILGSIHLYISWF